MPRHSKNNTALGFFTREEKQQLGYGTQKTRISRASCRDFDSCHLCLSMALEPMICRKGHLSCRECVLKSILKQKQEIELKKLAFEKQQQQLEEDDDKEKQEEYKKKLKEFEASQVNILPSTTKTKHTLRDDGRTVIEASKEILFANQKETARGSVLIDDVEAEKRKEKKDVEDPLKDIKSDAQAQYCFWIPSLTPSHAPTLLKAPTSETECFGSDPPHKLKLKQLVAVNFEPVNKNCKDHTKEDKNNRWRCPGCVKSLTNNRKVYVLKRCSHVVCTLCCDKFVKKDLACPLCSKPCAANEMIQIRHGGTGYAGHGEKVEAQSYNLAFR